MSKPWDRWAYALVLACGCGDSGAESGSDTVTPGAETGPCINGQCLGGLECSANRCVDVSDSDARTSGPSATTATGPTTTDPTTMNPGSSGSTTTDPGATEPALTEPALTDPGATDSGTTDPALTGTGTGETSNGDTGMTTLPDETSTGGACKPIELLPTKPYVVLVVDKSGSMSALKWDHDNNPGTPPVPRWQSMYAVLAQQLNKFEANMALGVGLFPSKSATASYNATACLVDASLEADMAFQNANTIMSVIPGPNTVNLGGTPMAKGVETALNALAKAPANVPRAIVLVGDGAAHCSANAPNNDALFEVYDPMVHTLVSQAYSQQQIPTYVIGIQISTQTTDSSKDGIPNQINPADKYNQLAIEGGRPRPGATKFYQVINEGELAAAVDTTLTDARGCYLTIGEQAEDPTMTVLTVSGSNYPYAPNLQCESESGWVYTDGSKTTMRLCGAACTSLKSAGKATVSLDC